MVETGGQTFPTYPVFLTPNQAGIIVDSNTPPGEARLVAEVDGEMSNRWRIEVVPHQPAIYTFNQDGVGQGIFTTTDFKLVTLGKPLVRDKLFIAWGNGWGASQFDTTGGLFDKRSQYDEVKIYFGDQRVADEDILYVGSAGGFAGGDQLIGRVPPSAPLGCGTPFFGVIDPVGPGSPIISNIVTVPISADGGPCGDQTGLSPDQISRITQGDELNVIDFTLDELNLFTSGVPDLFFLGIAGGRTINATNYKPPHPERNVHDDLAARELPEPAGPSAADLQRGRHGRSALDSIHDGS